MITPEQKTKIREMTLAKIPQKEIAKQLGLSRHLVRKEQARVGMRPHKPVTVSGETERKIFALLAKNHGEPFIARTLGLRQHVVHTILRRRDYQKPRGFYGCKYNLSKKELAAIRKDIRIAERKIAKEHAVSHEWLRKFRLRMWDCAGDKHWRRKRRAVLSTGDFAVLADKIAAKCFDGQLPNCPETIADTAMECVPSLRDAPTKARKYFHRQLLAAIRQKLANENAAQNSTWLN